MKREEQIKQAARDIALNWNVGSGNEFYYRLDKLTEMARWADEHPKYNQEQLMQELNDLQFAYDGKCAEVERLSNPWISVEERLPEGEDAVFVLFGDTNITGIGYMSEDVEEVWFINGWGIVDDVTHWMPIPQIKKGE